MRLALGKVILLHSEMYYCMKNYGGIVSNNNSTSKTESMGFWAQLVSFPGTFWTANMIEMFERLAYFGVRAVVGIYIVDAAVNGGLELSHEQRGSIFFIWAIIQSLLPMFTGGFSDRYGYKISLSVAFTINFFGYILMAIANSYWTFLGAACMVATGTAIFKPPLHGTLAHTVSEKNSSLGWGLFYQLVNIGGAVGPIIAASMRAMDWKFVFFASAGISLINFIPTLTIFKDYSVDVRREKRERGEEEKGAFATFADSILTLIKDVKFVIFLAIFSGFWLMFMQLFDTFPIFIDEWVDSRSALAWLQSHGFGFVQPDRYGNIPPEMMVNVDAATIVILMPLIGYLTGKFKPIVVMVVGMLWSTIALVFAGSVTAGAMVIFGIFLFAIGEMICSPKFSEYVGLMAPPEKKALYLGYSNIPFAIGWSLAGLLSGVLYGQFSDKYEFGRHHLVHELKMDSEFVELLDRTEVMPTLAAMLDNNDPKWHAYEDPEQFGKDYVFLELKKDTTKIISESEMIPLGEDVFERTLGNRDMVIEAFGGDEAKITSTVRELASAFIYRNNVPEQIVTPGSPDAVQSLDPEKYDRMISQLVSKLSLSDKQEEAFVSGLESQFNGEIYLTITNEEDTFAATKLLWDIHKPWRTWIFFGIIGLIATLGMLIYHFWLEAEAKKRKQALA